MSVDSETGFQRALQELLQRAHDNGVDVRGGWSVEAADDGGGWDVVIVELAPD